MKTNYQELIRAQAGLEDDEKEVVQEAEQQDQKETKRILKVQWLHQTVTTDMFNDISKQIEELEERARTLAYNYNVDQRHLEIINLLVRATELRNIRNTYGK